MADEFAAQTSNFLEWFKNLPGATFSDSIEITDLRSRGAGRGIVATRDIPADTTLFTIPRGSIISTETSEVARRLPQVFDLSAVLEDDGEDAGAGLDSWACLILVLVHEHLRGDASPWKAYLDVALPPAGAFDTPMFWSADELAELQTGPAAGKIGRAEAEDMFRNKIIPVAREREREDPSLFPGAGAMTEEELVELAHRVGSSIMAYAFDLEPEGGESDEGEEEQEGWVEDREGRSLMGMVPMADMLNADAEFNAHINHGDDALTATTLRDIRAGEEVLNYYGPHPNSELLRRYGYVTARHARYDVVEVPWALIEQAVAEQLGLPTDVVEKARGLLDEDEIEDTFVLERTTPDPGPDGTFPADAPPAAFTVPPPDLAEQLKAFLKAAKKVQPGSGVEDKRKRDEVAQSALVRCLGVLEAAYATTLEQDEALLAACAEENSSSSDRRKRMALVVRMGEKRLIREAREVLGAGESSEEGRAKRTKLDG